MDDPDDIEYEEIIHIDENINKSITEFLSNYEKNKKNNKSSPFLTIYEKTRILSERAQQIADGSKPLILNPDRFDTAYDIAFEELTQKKIPFIIQRPIGMGFEYYKLEDLHL